MNDCHQPPSTRLKKADDKYSYFKYQSQHPDKKSEQYPLERILHHYNKTQKY